MNNSKYRKSVITISFATFFFFWILIKSALGAILLASISYFVLNKLFKKKPELEKHWKVVTAGLFMLIIMIPIIRAASNDAQMREEKADIVSGQSNTYSYITSADSYERSVEAVLIDELGPSTAISKVEVFGNTLKLEYKGKENLNSKLTRQGILFDIKDMMQKIAPSIPENVSNVSFIVSLDLVDQYGNTNESPVVTVTLDRDTWQKIQWDNFLVDNFSSVAKVYRIHPALQK